MVITVMTSLPTVVNSRNGPNSYDRVVITVRTVHDRERSHNCYDHMVITVMTVTLVILSTVEKLKQHLSAVL